MDTLILSCSTGGGHNAAAKAIKEAFERRGHNATLLDPYTLAGHSLDRKVGNGYIRLAQHTPHLFGAIYKLGDAYRNLPIHSPVYGVNKLMRRRLSRYLSENHYDVIFTTHVYPGEMLAYLRNKGFALPKCIFVATDYACVPFTEESLCDYFITPSPLLEYDFIRRGIKKERLVPLGIPVSASFLSDLTQDEAKSQLSLETDKNYVLISGGSIGAGLIEKTIAILREYINTRPDIRLIVICGNNKPLYDRLYEKYSDSAAVLLIKSTDEMPIYMAACCAFVSKPGGLSSTEAAVSNTPLIHISPIPGCENMNMDFFAEHGMCIPVGNNIEKLPEGLSRLENEAFSAEIVANQSRFINKNAADDICIFAESII